VKTQEDKIFVKKFGKNLRKVRKSKKISMTKLAFDSGLEYSQISRIELGQINTSIAAVNSIALALKIETKELFDF
tara:strand:- start:276553 stop:276777 length:225 start_codon:yes stop_codon:yes gene_type:complete